VSLLVPNITRLLLSAIRKILIVLYLPQHKSMQYQRSYSKMFFYRLFKRERNVFLACGTFIRTLCRTGASPALFQKILVF